MLVTQFEEPLRGLDRVLFERLCELLGQHR
jgi:hypothetical protein